MKKLSQRLISYSLITISLVLSGCTPEKARALRGAALQFETEASEAITAIDQMLEKELAPAPRTTDEMQQEFINNILSTTGDLSPKIIDFAIDPYTVPLSPETLEKRKELINDLRAQYAEFAAIFNRLEAGSFLSSSQVARTEKIAKKLTLQMANLAYIITLSPPEFLQSRSAIIVQLEDLRNEYRSISLNTGNTITPRQQQIREKIGQLMEQWIQVKTEEKQLAEKTAKECLQAVVIGQQVSVLIDDYDRLSVNDIESILFQSLQVASSLTGMNYDGVKIKAKELFEFLKNDPYFKDVTVEANLIEVNDPTLTPVNNSQ